MSAAQHKTIYIYYVSVGVATQDVAFWSIPSLFCDFHTDPNPMIACTNTHSYMRTWDEPAEVEDDDEVETQWTHEAKQTLIYHCGPDIDQ